MFTQFKYATCYRLPVTCYWLFISCAFLLVPSFARAEEPNATEPNATERVLRGLEDTAREGGLRGAGEAPGPGAAAGKIIGFLLAFVGFAFFVLMVYGGILWMTARGKEEQIKKAQDLIKSAIIGLIIVFLAYVVTRYVLGALLGAVGL